MSASNAASGDIRDETAASLPGLRVDADSTRVGQNRRAAPAFAVSASWNMAIRPRRRTRPFANPLDGGHAGVFQRLRRPSPGVSRGFSSLGEAIPGLLRACVEGRRRLPAIRRRPGVAAANIF